MDRKTKILIICQHNSGRSQMAEAYLNQFAGDRLVIESAGLEPSDKINPLVAEVMKEAGFDLSGKTPRSVFEKFKAGKLYDHLITVCHESEAQCPVFPGITKRWYMPFPDPAKVEGTREEKLAKVREIRDAIKEWLSSPREGAFSYKDLIRS